MAGIRKNSGHAVTGSLPSSSDAVQVRPANISFSDAPVTAKKKAASGFPPAK